MLLEHKASLPEEPKPWKCKLPMNLTQESSTHRSSLLMQCPDWNLLLKGINGLFIAECINSYYTFFPVHAGRGLKPWPIQRLLHQENIWKHRSSWMKLQLGQACVQQLKLLGAQQLEDRQGKPEIAQLNPLQTMFDMLFVFFFYKSLLPWKWGREL